MGETELIEIIKKAKNGDQYAFELLSKRYKSYIKSLSLKYYIPTEDEQGIYQNGLIGIWRGVKYFDEYKVSKANLFMKMCIKRNIYTEIRQSNRKKHKVLSESYDIEAGICEDENDVKKIDKILKYSISTEDEVIQCFEEKKMQDCISNVIDKLPKMQKECMKLYMNEIKPSEICNILNLKPKQVDNALERAKRNFKKKYNSIEEFKIANSL